MGVCQGVSGQIAFGSNGNPIEKTIVFEHVVNNQLQVLATLGEYRITNQTVPC